MGYSTYTPYLSAPPHASSLQFHPYARPQPPPGPVLPPIDFRRAFYPASRSVSAESNSSQHYRKRVLSTSRSPPILEALLEPLPPPRYQESPRYAEVKRERPDSSDDIFFSRRPSQSFRMSNPDPTAALALHFAMNGRDGELSSVRSSDNDIPVIPPEIRFDDTLNSAESPLDQDPNNLSMDDGTPRQPFSRSPELRVTHKLAERKRRKEMKDLFDELRDHLPPERGIKSSKWEILSKSIDYVTFLKKQNADAVTEIDRLRRELDIARGGTGQYTPYTFSLPMAYPAPGTYAAAPAQTQPQVPPQVPPQPPAPAQKPE